MPAISSAGVLDMVARLLPATQLGEARQALARKFRSPERLLEELVRRGWLTFYQARLILQGKGTELTVGPYVILEPIAKGGGGKVYKARHGRMNRIVALKVLRTELARDAEAVQRFHREIEVISQLSHPNIVHAYEAGPMGSLLVLVLEYVDGPSLEELVGRGGPLPAPTACEYVRQAAVGLQHAHEHGLVHRDVKPSNLILAKAHGSQPVGSRVIKLLDLGLARLEQPGKDSSTSNLTILAGKSVMQGTPDYMAPEQALDFHSADIRADIYSLGCTLYFLLAGRPPFSGKSLAEKLMKHQQAQPPLEELKLPSGPADVLRKMLAKRSPDRFQTPGEVAEALRPFAAMPEGTHSTISATFPTTEERAVRPPSRRRMLLAALILLLGLLAAGGSVLFSGSGAASTGKEAIAAPLRPTLDYGPGFAASAGLTFNGSAKQQGGAVRLTENKDFQAGSFFANQRVGVRRFTTTFDFLLTEARADGFTFVIQGNGPKALGERGSSLGYKGIAKSVAVKFDLYNNVGEGNNSTGLYQGGVEPHGGEINLAGTGIDLHGGRRLRAALTYDGSTLKVTIGDTVTGKSAVQNYPVDIPSAVGGDSAYVGFTGATGGLSAVQDILSWTFTSE